ncbi:MAG: outer membrane lipoprotein carrier protein LolA [Acidobacteriota bacterium]
MQKSCRSKFLTYLGLSALIGNFVAGMVPQALDLEEILTRMDQRGSTLNSMSSTIVQKKWTDILEEFDQGESGRFDFLRDGESIYLRRDIMKPQQNSLVVRDGEVLFYQPKIKQLQRYDLGKSRDRAEFLLLGFGSNKEGLKEAYDIRLGENEMIEGRETYLLELTPKSDQVSAHFSQIVLWVDLELWVPIQQKLVEPTRDYLLIRFGDIDLNPKLTKSRFDLKIADDVVVVGS